MWASFGPVHKKIGPWCRPTDLRHWACCYLHYNMHFKHSLFALSRTGIYRKELLVVYYVCEVAIHKVQKFWSIHIGHSLGSQIGDPNLLHSAGISSLLSYCPSFYTGKMSVEMAAHQVQSFMSSLLVLDHASGKLDMDSNWRPVPNLLFTQIWHHQREKTSGCC